MTNGPVLHKDAIRDHVLPNVESFANFAEDWIREAAVEQLQAMLTHSYAQGLRDGYQQCIDDAARDLAAPEESA